MVSEEGVRYEVAPECCRMPDDPDIQDVLYYAITKVTEIEEAGGQEKEATE